MLDRATFLSSADDKLQRANAAQEQKRLNAVARAVRMKEIESIIKPYDDWFHSKHVRTSFNISSSHPPQLSWILQFADEVAMTLSVKDDDAKEALELSLSFSKGGHPTLYVDLPFGHSGEAGQHIEAKAAAVRLDSRWSADAFESFIQELIAAFLDDAPHHGGTAYLSEEPRRTSSPF